jgi:Sec-independent protein translocase protein TatA
MDSFFGIGLPELILILLLSGIVMGPHRIRQVAHTIGRTTAQLQRVSRQFARQLNAELDALDGDMVRNSLNDMRDLQREVQELRRELGSVPNSLRGQGQGLLDETEASLKQSSSTSAEDAVIESPDPAPDPAAPSEQDPVTTPAPVQVATSLPNPTATPAPKLPPLCQIRPLPRCQIRPHLLSKIRPPPRRHHCRKPLKFPEIPIDV